MPDISWSEMAIILLVALIVIGPKDLPQVARTVGQWVRKARTMAREFQNSLESMAREAELDKVKDEIEKASRTDVRAAVNKHVDPDGKIEAAFDLKDRPKPVPMPESATPVAPPSPAEPTDRPAAKTPESDAASGLAAEKRINAPSHAVPDASKAPAD
ncbi:Sec-independent protein translocase protein TatB [Marinivivus vitaminiproducens]|uniref:Sec-independent protein translocase protein TatB n=1 Tax=Marinivivus vitaminiproducens TaxID=3035935 RepID=UPI0027A28C92|nr:Sec-independent protein translocase protein TatB [Geminicoccaceae bacterium SCSIO 64248]